MDDNYQKVARIKKMFSENLITQFGNTVEINGGDHTSPYILSITFKSDFFKNDAEGMLMFLDINGIAASQGSACTSGTLKPSHVILGMGKSEEDANGTIRFSFSPHNTSEEVEYTFDILVKLARNFTK